MSRSHTLGIRPLHIAAVLAAGLMLAFSSFFGWYVTAGLGLFLFASVVTLFCRKLYHLFVLTGVFLLFCVFIEPSPSDLVFCAAIPLGLLTVQLKPTLRRGTLLAVLLLFAHFLVCLPSVATCANVGSAVRYYLISLYLFLMALFLCCYATKETILLSILRGYLLAAICSFLAGLLGYLGFFQNTLMADAFRIRGLFKDPNVFGPFFIPAILLVIHDIKLKKLLHCHAAVHGVLIAMLTLGVIFSFSRAAWINLAVSLLVYFLLTGQLLKLLSPKRIAAILGSAAIAIGLLLSPIGEKTGILDFLVYRAQLQDYDQERFASQRGGIQLVVENPLGYGTGQFEAEIERITGLDLSAHSLYVRTAVESGVAGFLLFFGALGWIICGLLRRQWGWRRYQKAISAGPSKALPPGKAEDATAPTLQVFPLPAVIAVLLGLMVNSLVVDTIHWRHFWFFIGMGLIGLNEPSAQPPMLSGEMEN